MRGLCFLPPTSDLAEGYAIVCVLKKRQTWDPWPSTRLFLSSVLSLVTSLESLGYKAYLSSFSLRNFSPIRQKEGMTLL